MVEVRAGGARLATFTIVGARVAWVVTAALGGRAVGAALADHAASTARALTLAAWVGWTVGAVALVVPGVSTLTVVRALVPGSLVVAAATALGGAPAGDVAALAVPAAVTSVLVGSAELGRAWVQASAYGDERRFPLRPPLGYLGATVSSWVVWAVSAVIGVIAAAHGRWLVAGPALALAVLGTWWAALRWHQLSRRWLVVVPAGVVVHDPVGLIDTLMLPRRAIADVAVVAGAGRTGAADLTGPRPGPALTLQLAEPSTAVLAADRDHPRGRAIHLRALTVAPSRPGAAWEQVRRRRAAGR